jgi:hypothetical protein
MYTDKDGKDCYVSKGNDQFGRPLKRRFTFTYAQRTIRIPNSQADVIKHIEEHPNCAGSPNGDYEERNGKITQQGIFFKKIDEGADAKVAVNAMIEGIEAQNFVNELDKDELRDAAVVLCNCYDHSPLMQQFELLNLAKNNPAVVLKYKNKDTNQDVISLFRRAVNLGIIVDDNIAFFLGKMRMGASEDAAVKFLLNNKGYLDSVREKVDGVKPTSEQKVVETPAPKAVKSRTKTTTKVVKE